MFLHLVINSEVLLLISGNWLLALLLTLLDTSLGKLKSTDHENESGFLYYLKLSPCCVKCKIAWPRIAKVSSSSGSWRSDQISPWRSVTCLSTQPPSLPHCLPPSFPSSKHPLTNQWSSNSVSDMRWALRMQQKTRQSSYPCNKIGSMIKLFFYLCKCAVCFCGFFYTISNHQILMVSFAFSLSQHTWNCKLTHKEDSEGKGRTLFNRIPWCELFILAFPYLYNDGVIR